MLLTTWNPNEQVEQNPLEKGRKKRNTNKQSDVDFYYSGFYYTINFQLFMSAFVSSRIPTIL